MFRHRRRGFFQNFGNEVKAFAIFREASTRHTIVGQFALVGGLHGGNRAVFGGGNFDELPGTTAVFSAQIKMVAHKQQERFGAGELMCAPDRMTVAERFTLFDKLQPFAVRAGGGAIHIGITGENNDTNFLRTRIQRFFHDDGQRGLGFAVAIHQGLQRQRPLTWPGGGDDCFAYVHRSGVS